MEVTVYLDVLFAVNFLMDLVMVFLAVLGTKSRISMWRLTLGAGLLALYGTLIVFPKLEGGFSLPGRIAVSLISVCLICPKGKRGKGFLLFWLISVTMGGGIFALSMMTEMGQDLRAMMLNGSLYLDISMEVLGAGIMMTYGLIWGFCRMSVRNFSKERILIPFCLTVQGKEISFTALLDTGCELTVPGTGDAMLLLSKKEIGESVIEKTFDVPISTASGTGCVKAFYPERLVCNNPDWKIQGIPAIGIVKEEFSADGLYTALCNPDMLDRKNGGEEDERKKDHMGKFLAKNCRVVKGWKNPTGVLHRRKRDASAATWQGGGSEASGTTGQSRKTTRCTADLD